jgi:hypothetical protein
VSEVAGVAARDAFFRGPDQAAQRIPDFAAVGDVTLAGPRVKTDWNAAQLDERSTEALKLGHRGQRVEVRPGLSVSIRVSRREFL